MNRRGRPKAGEREERRQLIIDAAQAELAEHGYENITMLGIAKRAGSSKETLYSWFGNKEDLFAEIIRQNGDRSAEQIQKALDSDADPRQTLVGYSIGLLTLLTAPGPVALNRGAMSSPALADALLQNGRHRIGPLVETYLSLLAERRVIEIDNADAAFELLYGLVVQDTQIRVLLGEPAPPPALIKARAETAVDRFLSLAAASSS